MKSKQSYIATRGVSWRAGGVEVNRDAGDDVSDAPADVLKDLLAWDPPAAEATKHIIEAEAHADAQEGR